jgi:membrane protease YdiL (CAAX protease family)
VLALAFYPAMILAAWGMATLLQAPAEYPVLWGQPALQVLPLYALTFAVTLLIQGGNEEPGWRGFLQPELQTWFSPLLAAILVSLVWSLWHLPLFLNGFYGEGGLLAGMVGGAVYRVFLAIFLAWFYSRSGGNLFLTCWMHASFNLMPSFLPTFEPGLVVLWILAVAGIVFKDKMWRVDPLGSVETPKTDR